MDLDMKSGPFLNRTVLGQNWLSYSDDPKLSGPKDLNGPKMVDQN